MTLKETIKSIAEGGLSDEEQLALLKKIEKNILSKKQEKEVERQKDYIQAAIQTIVDRLKTHEKTVAEKLKQVENYVRQPVPAGKDGKAGRDGKDGLPGLSGRNGRDGVDGKNGLDGVDGVGIASVEVTFDNSLVVRLTDGNEIDAGQINVESQGNGSGQQVVVQQYSGPKIFVQDTEPTGASPGDIWLDTSP